MRAVIFMLGTLSLANTFHTPKGADQPVAPTHVGVPWHSTGHASILSGA
jgi:hypothetical protein